MKSIKLLMAALVVSATFAACTKEEAPVVQTDEIVGAELVGTNISVDFGRNTDTKLTDNGWEKTDELGLAWVIKGAYGSAQEYDYGTSLTNRVALNHQFAVEEGSNRFTTKGNVYKGWHFGYYPFRYMEQPNLPLDFEINPDMEAKWSDDYYTSAFYLSAREFLTKEQHLNAKNQLENVAFQMERVQTTIGVRVTPSAEFADPALSGLNITKFTISAGTGNEVFTTGTAVVEPKKLAAMLYDEDDVYDADATREAFYTNLPSALTGLTKAYSASTTITAEAGLDLSGAQLLRLHTMPVAAPVEIALNKVKFTIAVNGGSFSIGYTKNAEEGTPESFNNAAIEAFVAAYAEDGVMTAPYTMVDGKPVYSRLALDLKLTPANFTPSYKSISNIDEWNDAVAVADALGKDVVPHFVVDGEVKISADKVLNFPKKGLTVETKSDKGQITVNADYVMPEELAAALDADDVVVVIANKTLTIEDGLEVEAAITNNGTIKVGAATVARIINNKRIEVVYGSHVTTADDPVGVIAYNVKEGDSAYMINQMVNNVNVNTLVIADDVTFDLSMVDKNVVMTDPYYTAVTPGQKLQKMDQMNFELNNGTLKAAANSGAIVKKVDVIGGDNAMWNVNVENNLTVAAGNVTVDAEKIGDYKESLKVKNLIDIKANSELTANVEMFTETIKYTAATAKVTVNSGNTIWYTVDEETGGTKSGKVEYYSTSALPGIFTTVDANTAIPNIKTNAEALSDYVKGDSFKEGSTIVLPEGEITLEQNAEYNKSFTLVGNGTTIKIASKGIKCNGVSAGHDIVVNLKNLTIDAGDSYGVYVRGKATVNMQNVEIKTTGKKAILIDNASDQKEGIKSTLNATNLTIPATSEIHYFTLFKGYQGKNWESKVYINYEGGNITDNKIKPDTGAKSTGTNLYINGQVQPAN